MAGHRYGDERVVEWLNQEREWRYERSVPYHPRSDRHGAAQCRFFIDDLLFESDLIAEAAEAGNLVYEEDYQVGEGGLSWIADLVIGPPSSETQPNSNGVDNMERGEPSEIYRAVDAKSIMTEHQKARRNRQRDINSFADIIHHHHGKALTAGILLVNMAERFDSPLRVLEDVTEHRHIERVVGEIVDLFDSIDRSGGEISASLDGASVVVVEHTNLVKDIGGTRLVTEPPAPQEGDRVHYPTFVKYIAELFEERFF